MAVNHFDNLKSRISNSFLGAHFSVAGGIENAIRTAQKYQCRALQIFTKNARTWKEKILTNGEASRFAAARKKAGIKFLLSHASYLINIATSETDKKERSRMALKAEIERSQILGIDYVVMHPGAYTTSDLTTGIRSIADTINTIYNSLTGQPPRLLLETTAGQGTQIGHTFEQLKQIIQQVDINIPIGICLDTCHIFAAGYDISNPVNAAAVFKDLDQIIGYDRLHALHLNDAKTQLACQKDRHEHIGKGHIGLEGFAFIMNHEPFRHLPKIIETPKFKNNTDMDNINLRKLARLIEI